MSLRKPHSGATAGRILYHRWRIGGFEYRSDLLAHDYMRRWTLSTPWGMVRLHHILRSDDRAHLHDHPMDFVSFILRGGYTEHRPDRPPRRFYPGDVVIRRAEDLHALELPEGRTTWTLVLASPIRREWGFATEDGWVNAGDYDAWKGVKRALREVATWSPPGVPFAKTILGVDDLATCTCHLPTATCPSHPR